ncbi:integrase domain-containing protein [Denitromonas halophila]|uniref:Fis family transcriptional regulator n=1 Tax=Denitromonas halophila TaxID=1629404 RepID=A0A557QSN2_9RHOO|nr:integrase domain-containing protein [Denitromonas halophila]TVO55925.1 Fis family transcriptional regulator [Denitromonas halophila]
MKGHGWKSELVELLAESGRRSAPQKGRMKPVSDRTTDARQAVLFQAFRQLHEMGYAIKSIYALREKHIEALVSRWDDEGLSASTLQNRISHLRTLAQWLGKGGMVRPSHEYVTDSARVRRSGVATYDHSWSAAGVDVEGVLAMVSAMDDYVGFQLRLCHAFYLRREEAVMFRPHRADKGDRIEVLDGTKGGRMRIVPLTTDYQRRVLDEAKSRVRSRNGHVGDPNRNLKQALNRFSYVLRRCGVSKEALGVTPHGLRHQGLNDTFESLAGIPSPIRCADPARVLAAADPDKVDHARQVVAEIAGHSRLSISGSYIGGLRGRKVELSPAQRKQMEGWSRLFQLHGRSDLSESERAEKLRLIRTLGVRSMAAEADALEAAGDGRRDERQEQCAGERHVDVFG